MRKNIALTAQSMNENEDGHLGPVPGVLVAAAGTVLLGIGAANDTGALAVIGGIVAGVGLIATSVMHHMKVEYDIYKRLNDLEAKK